MTEPESEHQPRERAVPCWKCGGTRTMTWNLSGLCDEHEKPLGQSTKP